ncbi:hypothetical protein G6F60_014865 [Rhizopus arrhizus]|nr:hypothetical protein G6F60_014865 [Rhizopus arrhizus]
MAQFGQRGFFEDAFVAVAGIVDQHVDGADVCFDIGDERIDGNGIGHVEQATEGAAGSQRFECHARCVVAHGTDHAVAGLQGLLLSAGEL